MKKRIVFGCRFRPAGLIVLMVMLSSFSTGLLFGQSEAKSPFRLKKEKDSVVLEDASGPSGKCLPVWQYNFGFMEHENVPMKDPRRYAGCYFHPLYGLTGEVLTENAPKDHYHHHGIFWTWPHVVVHEENGKTVHYDLWTSNTPIRQYFVKWNKLAAEPGKAVLSVENGWFVGPVERDADGNVTKGEKIMKETVTVTTWPVSRQNGVNGRFIDFDFCWIPLKHPISLRGAEKKSYGGFTIRFEPQGKKKVDTIITTPGSKEGRSEDADLLETPLPWADFTARFKENGDMSGVSIFISKDHPDFPPTWLTRYYGAMCVGWPGVVEQTFPAGHEIRLRYRLWIHDGQVQPEQIEKVYELFKISK